MGEQITAHEAAGRLGVDVRTLYAYVSRGSLHRSGADPNRRSLYDADEVELLVRRGRPRSGGRSRAGIDVVVGSSVSAIGDGWIRYRGIDPVRLISDGWTFERVAELLWNGSVGASTDTNPSTDTNASTDTKASTDTNADTNAEWQVPRAAVRAIGRTLASFGGDANVLDRMTAAMAVAGAYLDVRGVADPSAVSSRGLRRTLVAVLLESLPAPAPTSRSATTFAHASIAARTWIRLSPLRPTPARIAALDRALILLAEHELATSTLAVRIATSVRAPMTSALTCGLATLSGSAHAGAATRVHEGLVRAAAARRRNGSTPRSTPRSTTHSIPATEPALASRAADARTGFGHPVHLVGDPRAEPLLDAVDTIASVGAHRIIAATRLAGSRIAPPNSDFALGALCYAAKMRPGAAEAIFAIARSAGWIAHAAEELEERPVRFRARAVPRPGAATPASRTVADRPPNIARH